MHSSARTPSFPLIQYARNPSPAQSPGQVAESRTPMHPPLGPDGRPIRTLYQRLTEQENTPPHSSNMPDRDQASSACAIDSVVHAEGEGDDIEMFRLMPSRSRGVKQEEEKKNENEEYESIAPYGDFNRFSWSDEVDRMENFRAEQDQRWLLEDRSRASSMSKSAGKPCVPWVSSKDEERLKEADIRRLLRQRSPTSSISETQEERDRVPAQPPSMATGAGHINKTRAHETDGKDARDQEQTLFAHRTTMHHPVSLRPRGQQRSVRTARRSAAERPDRHVQAEKKWWQLW